MDTDVTLRHANSKSGYVIGKARRQRGRIGVPRRRVGYQTASC